jgi:hypothetical protein
MISLKNLTTPILTFTVQMFVFSKGCPQIFASRIGIVSYFIFNVKLCEERKKGDFLFLNFKLAANML